MDNTINTQILTQMKQTLVILIILIALGGCKNDNRFQLSSDIYILDKEKPVKSLAELKSKLEGRPFFIDRWASWCSPCVEEFKHSGELYEFLKNNGIEMVYLNSDSDLEENTWFDFIKKHNLKGNHLRLDSALKADLIEKQIFIPMIPQYLLFNEQGDLVTNKALKPSSKESLYNQIRLGISK